MSQLGCKMPPKWSTNFLLSWESFGNDQLRLKKLRILLSGWHFGAILLFLRQSRRLEQIAGAKWIGRCEPWETRPGSLTTTYFDPCTYWVPDFIWTVRKLFIWFYLMIYKGSSFREGCATLTRMMWFCPFSRTKWPTEGVCPGRRQALGRSH